VKWHRTTVWYRTCRDL